MKLIEFFEMRSAGEIFEWSRRASLDKAFETFDK